MLKLLISLIALAICVLLIIVPIGKIIFIILLEGLGKATATPTQKTILEFIDFPMIASFFCGIIFIGPIYDKAKQYSKGRKNLFILLIIIMIALFILNY